MNYIPLRMEEDPILWNRNQSEFVLFEKTLNQTNVNENIEYLKLLDAKSVSRFKASLDVVNKNSTWNTIATGFDSAMGRQYMESLHFINQIILLAPKKSINFKRALEKRFDINVDAYAFSTVDCPDVQLAALSDGEMYYYLYKNSAPLKTIHKIVVYVCIFKFNLGIVDNIDEYLNAFHICEGKLEDQKHTFPKKIQEALKKLQQEIILHTPKADNTEKHRNFRSNVLKFSQQKNDGMRGVVVAKKNISKGQIVYAETPRFYELQTLLTQCEYCFKIPVHVYTCPGCCMKTYCGVECLKKDKEEHDFECNGYFNLVLIQLNARCLFRALHELCRKLCALVFVDASFKPLRTAEECYNNIKRLITQKRLQHDTEVFFYLISQVNYDAIPGQIYNNIIKTAFRLSLFVDRSTTFIERYFENLSISNKQKLILLGGMLIHLQSSFYEHEFNFGYCIEFEKPTDDKPQLFPDLQLVKGEDKKMDEITPPFEPMIHMLNVYIHKIVNLVQNTESGKWYLNDINAGIVFPNSKIEENRKILEKSTLQECCDFLINFVVSFDTHLPGNVIKLRNYRNFLPQFLTMISRDLNKFSYSCDSNIQLMLLENGCLVGKTLVDIEKGSRITLSFGYNPKLKDRNSRREYLDYFKIQCECKYCVMPLEDEPLEKTGAIICKKCNVIYTKGMIQCPTCKAHYCHMNPLLKKNLRMLDKELELAEINLKDSPDLKKLQLSIYQETFEFCKNNFGPHNILRAKNEINYIRFLVKNRLFNYDIYSMLKDVYERIEEYVDEYSLSYSFHPHILYIIRTVFKQIVNEPSPLIKDSTLVSLYDFAIEIIQKQRSISKFYQTDQYHAKSFISLEHTFVILYNIHLNNSKQQRYTHLKH